MRFFTLSRDKHSLPANSSFGSKWRRNEIFLFQRQFYLYADIIIYSDTCQGFFKKQMGAETKKTMFGARNDKACEINRNYKSSCEKIIIILFIRSCRWRYSDLGMMHFSNICFSFVLSPLSNDSTLACTISL